MDLPPIRDDDSRGIDENVADRWKTLVESLYDCRSAEEVTVQLSDHAKMGLLAYQHEVARRQLKDLRDVRPFAARWAENACRIALNLHIAKYRSAAAEHLLGEKTARAAIEIMKWLAAQQLFVLAEARESQVTARKERLVQILKDAGGKKTLDQIRKSNGIAPEDTQSIVDEFSAIFDTQKHGKAHYVCLRKGD